VHAAFGYTQFCMKGNVMTDDTEQRNTLLNGNQLQRQQYQKQRQRQQQEGQQDPSVAPSRDLPEKQHQSLHNRISEDSQVASQSCDQ
jgi:hypothetical protein